MLTADYLPHLLPVDQTLHWANPPGGTAGRDTRPNLRPPHLVPTRARCPWSPTCTVPWGSATRATATPRLGICRPQITSRPATPPKVPGTISLLARRMPNLGQTWGPGYATFEYPNANRASTIWYHDHALGMTRLNVYAGPAGFYLIRGRPDDALLDSRRPDHRPCYRDPPPKRVTNFRSTRPTTRSPSPSRTARSTLTGRCSTRTPGNSSTNIVGPFIPAGDFSPIWNPEFFGNMMMVNGNTWPFQTVEQRRYRFRFLNGCQSRFLILDFNQIPGVEVWAIGNEGGFLAAPVNLTATNGNRLLMGLAERADLIVDFTNVPVGNYVLGNVGPDEPFGGGVPGVDFRFGGSGFHRSDHAVPRCPGRRTGSDHAASVPAAAGYHAATGCNRYPSAGAHREDGGRLRRGGDLVEGPVEAASRHCLQVIPMWPPEFGPERMWMDPVTENPAVGATEVWEMYNTTGDAHPMHVHEVVFEVVNRQDIFVR